MYEVPESKRSIDQNQFRFKVPYLEGVYSIPKLGYIPHAVAEEADTLSKLEILGVALALELEDTVAALRTLDGLEMGNLTVAWYQASGITPGESEASVTSSENTQGPSDTTSSPTADPSTV